MTRIHPDDFEAVVLWAILLHDWANIHGVERTIPIENYHVLGPPGPLAKMVLSGMMEAVANCCNCNGERRLHDPGMPCAAGDFCRWK